MRLSEFLLNLNKEIRTKEILALTSLQLVTLSLGALDQLILEIEKLEELRLQNKLKSVRGVFDRHVLM